MNFTIPSSPSPEKFIEMSIWAFISGVSSGLSYASALSQVGLDITQKPWEMAQGIFTSNAMWYQVDIYAEILTSIARIGQTSECLWYYSEAIIAGGKYYGYNITVVVFLVVSIFFFLLRLANAFVYLEIF